MNKVLYLVVGKSGAGKDYIVDKICKDFKKARVISRTTRPKRQGKDLHMFVDEETARKEWWISLARTNYNNYKYYVIEEDIKEKDFYIIDVKGVKRIKSLQKAHTSDLLNNTELITIFIDSPWYIRACHMRKRGDSIKSIIHRLKLDRVEFKDFQGDLNFKSSNEMYEHFKNIAERM